MTLIHTTRTGTMVTRRMDIDRSEATLIVNIMDRDMDILTAMDMGIVTVMGKGTTLTSICLGAAMTKAMRWTSPR